MKFLFRMVVVFCLSLFFCNGTQLAHAESEPYTTWTCGTSSYATTASTEHEIWIEVKVQKVHEWQRKYENEDAGTTGMSRRIEALRMGLFDSNKKIEYQIYVDGQGWSRWYADGEIADNRGGKRPISGLNIKVTDRRDGTLVDVEYRAHVERVGWTDYMLCNEEIGNKVGRIEAITVRFSNPSDIVKNG